MLYSLRKRKEEFLKRKYLDYKSMNHKLELFQDVEIEIRTKSHPSRLGSHPVGIRGDDEGVYDRPIIVSFSSLRLQLMTLKPYYLWPVEQERKRSKLRPHHQSPTSPSKHGCCWSL